MTCSVIIPTLNAAKELPQLLRSLKNQSFPCEILVVDSSSDDGTPELAAGEGARVMSVSRKEFDHGGTRDDALRQTSGDVVVFMTQDALPENEHSLEKLLAPLMKDPAVAAVGGRQLPKVDATAYEKQVRAFNYPAESRSWDVREIPRLGVRSFLISDVFAAYRREAYLAVGGFDRPVMTNEDMLMAQKLLAGGYRLAYSGEACVYHSHHLTWPQQYRRNYIVGKTMVRYADRFSHVQELGEGVELFKQVTRQLIRQKQFVSLPLFWLDCSARLLGNRFGRISEERKSNG